MQLVLVVDGCHPQDAELEGTWNVRVPGSWPLPLRFQRLAWKVWAESCSRGEHLHRVPERIRHSRAMKKRPQESRGASRILNMDL